MCVYENIIFYAVEKVLETQKEVAKNEKRARTAAEKYKLEGMAMQVMATIFGATLIPYSGSHSL